MVLRRLCNNFTACATFCMLLLGSTAQAGILIMPGWQSPGWAEMKETGLGAILQTSPRSLLEGPYDSCSGWLLGSWSPGWYWSAPNMKTSVTAACVEEPAPKPQLCGSGGICGNKGVSFPSFCFAWVIAGAHLQSHGGRNLKNSSFATFHLLTFSGQHQSLAAAS